MGHRLMRHTHYKIISNGGFSKLFYGYIPSISVSERVYFFVLKLKHVFIYCIVFLLDCKEDMF